MTTIPDSFSPAEQARAKLAIALMNQGHAQQLSDEPALVQAAASSYEQAIAILRQLPYAQHPQIANSLGAAWMNRGQLLHRLRSNAQIAPAMESFNEALTIFQQIPQAGETVWIRRNFLGTLLNRACLLVDLSEHRAALNDARAALSLALKYERPELVDADLALKLRRVACDSIGQLITVVPTTEQASLASEASDLVDDGLALAREWSAKGETALDHVASRLFRFGAQLYRVNQPHFLAEFIAEQIDEGTPSPEIMEIAMYNIEVALNTRASEPFLMIGDAASERHLQTARELEALRQRLIGLHPGLSSLPPS
jgi:tetratricopeptide (TPR) repeat protein